MEYPNYLDKHTLTTNSDDMFALRQLRKGDKNTIVHLLKEKINNAIAEYKNPEQHDYYTGKSIFEDYNQWLHYLDTQWDGRLNRTFELFAEGVGLQKSELYKMIIGLLVNKHLDYVNDWAPWEDPRYNGDNDVDEDNFMIQTGAC